MRTSQCPYVEIGTYQSRLLLSPQNLQTSLRSHLSVTVHAQLQFPRNLIICCLIRFFH